MDRRIKCFGIPHPRRSQKEVGGDEECIDIYGINTTITEEDGCTDVLFVENYGDERMKKND